MIRLPVMPPLCAVVLWGNNCRISGKYLPKSAKCAAFLPKLGEKRVDCAPLQGKSNNLSYIFQMIR
jgi:hypothetical protein